MSAGASLEAREAVVLLPVCYCGFTPCLWGHSMCDPTPVGQGPRGGGGHVGGMLGLGALPASSPCPVPGHGPVCDGWLVRAALWDSCPRGL